MSTADFAQAIAEATAAGDLVRLSTLAMQLLGKAAAAEELEERERRRRAADAERKREARDTRRTSEEIRGRRAASRKSADVPGHPTTSMEVQGNPRTSVDFQDTPPVPPSPPLPAPLPTTPPFNPPAPPGESSTAGPEYLDRERGPEPAVEPSANGRKLEGDHPELAGLPLHAVRLVTVCYAMSKASRRKDAIDQLREALCHPELPGAQLDRNTWVRAANPAQLDLACRAVLQQPPRNLELAVRFVLLELLKLQARQANEATEGAAARNREALEHEQRWRKARARAILAWERDNPERAGALRAEAKRQIPEAHAGQRWAQEVELQLYATLAGEAIGFPPPEKWQDRASKPAGLQAIGEIMP